jgi:aspartyl/asparaginyl-tRNA synthetase
VRGWVQTARTQKSVAFLHVTDGSNVKGLQAVFEDPSLTKG